MVYVRLKIVGIFPLKTWRGIVFFIYLCSRNQKHKSETFHKAEHTKVFQNGKLFDS